MIDPTFWQSETMASLLIEQRYLFIGLISNADDQGRLGAHPSLIRSLVFPYDDIEVDTVSAGLEALSEAGFLHLYSSNGQRCLQIINWWQYQKPQWAYPSSIPAPDNWQDRLRYREGGQVLSQNWYSPGGFRTEALPKPLPKDDAASNDADSQAPSIAQNSIELEQDSIDIVSPGGDTRSNNLDPKARHIEESTPRLTQGQRQFLGTLGATRFKNNEQKAAVLALEQKYGTARLLEGAAWAAKCGMSVGRAVVSLETALPNWGKPKTGGKSNERSKDARCTDPQHKLNTLPTAQDQESIRQQYEQHRARVEDRGAGDGPSG